MKDHEKYQLLATAHRLAYKYNMNWYDFVQILNRASEIWQPTNSDLKFYMPRECYRVAVAVIDDKPVHIFDTVYLKFDDELMNMGGRECQVLPDSNDNQLFLRTTNGSIGMFDPKYCSLTPPKPKTVMVELPYDFVVNQVDRGQSPVLTNACIKAFKELK